MVGERGDRDETGKVVRLVEEGRRFERRKEKGRDRGRREVDEEKCGEKGGKRTVIGISGTGAENQKRRESRGMKERRIHKMIGESLTKYVPGSRPCEASLTS